MIELVVCSGKGGTGKTTFAVNLAYFAAESAKGIVESSGNVSNASWNNSEDNIGGVRLLDCDVEAPNCHLFIESGKMEENSVTAMKPEWIRERCTFCGKCVEVCHYNAMALAGNEIILFNELCHSCGACAFVCPEDAVIERKREIGKKKGYKGKFKGKDNKIYIAHPSSQKKMPKIGILI